MGVPSRAAYPSRGAHLARRARAATQLVQAHHDGRLLWRDAGRRDLGVRDELCGRAREREQRRATRLGGRVGQARPQGERATHSLFLYPGSASFLKECDDAVWRDVVRRNVRCDVMMRCDDVM